MKNNFSNDEDWANKDDFDNEFWEDRLLYYYDDLYPNISNSKELEDEDEDPEDCLICVRVSDPGSKFEVAIFHSKEYDDIDFDWIEIQSSLSFEVATQIKKRVLYYLTSLPRGKNYDVETVLKTITNIADIYESNLTFATLPIEKLVKNYYRTKALLRLVGVLHLTSVNSLKLELNNNQDSKDGIEKDWGLNYVSRSQKKFNLQRFKEENPDIYKKYCETSERDYLLPIKNAKKEIDLDIEEIEKISSSIIKQLNMDENS